MTSGTVNFLDGPTFGLYDLQFLPKNPAQLDMPTQNSAGNWEFDSKYDVVYQAMVSTGLEPVHRVSGYGTAHVVGTATKDPFHQVFDSELVSLELFGLSRYPDFKFRESPTLRSAGVTTRDDLCPPCASIFTRWQISSFFDVFAEVSFDGGDTWTPGERSFHIEQPANPMQLGDFNGDDSVDAADYIVWRNIHGSTDSSSADYDLWRISFGEATDSASATPGAVPEPSIFWQIAISAVVLLLRRSKVHYRLATSVASVSDGLRNGPEGATLPSIPSKTSSPL
jgi:hypothetical protein